jgi:hypothetical protein
MTRGFHRILVSAALATTLVSSAFAGPNPGLYDSVDLGGSLLTGRASQSWALPANGNQGLFDVYNALSWDSALLGTQWGIQCGVQPAVQGVQDNRVAGNGNVIYTNTFQGGTFYLNNGPWCTGGPCTGSINTTHEVVTVRYVNNVPVRSVVNIDTDGTFVGGQCVLRFVIANGVGRGDTDGGPKPPTYPDFLDPACAPSRIFGSWGDVITISMQIDCPTPNRNSTWGALKSRYR